MQSKISKYLEIAIKAFFIGLLVQFFLQTFITYKLGWDGKFWNGIWLWKEVLILIFMGIVGIWIFQSMKNLGTRNFFQKLTTTKVFRFFLFFLWASGISFLLAIGIQKVGLWTFILSFKYNLLGFLIFLLGVGLVWFSPLKTFNFSKWYQKVLKRIIYGWFIRWGVIYLIPWLLKFAGYSRNAFEGTLDANPPAVYLTQINHGLVRNQFLFERPISFGFFLVAFRPLFALGFLRKQSRKSQILRTLAFGALVFSTLSRAAIGVWLLQSAILALLIYWKQAKKLILFVGIPWSLILLAGLWHFRGIFAREHSNTGHAVLLKEGIKLGMESPFFWRGAGYSGPASHQICFNAKENSRCEKIKEINTEHQITTYGYNPENQYVQIFMEYGILGLLPWLFCFFWLLWSGLRVLIPLLSELKKSKKADQRKISQLFVLFAFWVGMLGLALEGLVLHSFVDRMIVYPMMLLFWLSYGEVESFEEKKTL